MALLKPNSIINDDLILQGPIIDGNGSKGSNGQYLTSNGSSSAPTWQNFPSGSGGSNETTECYKVNLLQTTLNTSTSQNQLTSWLNTTVDNEVSFTLGSGTVDADHIKVSSAGRYLVGFNLDINYTDTTNTGTLRTIFGFEITVNTGSGDNVTGHEVSNTYIRGGSNDDDHFNSSANHSTILNLPDGAELAIKTRRCSGSSGSNGGVFRLSTNSNFFALKIN